jgi:MerR family transcriptional regulator, light-induced transcriptional regulator
MLGSCVVRWSRGIETSDGIAHGPNIRSPAIADRRRDPAAIRRLLESHLLPHIAFKHQPITLPSDPEALGAFAEREIFEFAQLALRSQVRPLLARIERHVADGIALETIYLDLLQPAARHLGVLWADDAVDFASVTLGLCHMHRLVRELSAAFHAEGKLRSDRCLALLTPAGKEQHSLGLLMVGEFLRREGWGICSGPFPTNSELSNAVRTQWFTLVGFSLSCESGLQALASQIRCVRHASLNRAVCVLAGGRIFIDHPELVSRVGADATACDARQAAIISRKLAAMPVECRA